MGASAYFAALQQQFLANRDREIRALRSRAKNALEQGSPWHTEERAGLEILASLRVDKVAPLREAHARLVAGAIVSLRERGYMEPELTSLLMYLAAFNTVEEVA